MKARTIVLLVGSASAPLIESNAFAVYTNLQIVAQQVTLQDGTVMNRYRLYANCSDPNDYITAVSGSPSLGNIRIQSVSADGSGVGSIFYNKANGGGAFAPPMGAIAMNPDVVHDTFVTIGISIAEQGSGPPLSPDQTGLSPGATGIGNVTQINSNNMGWFSPGPVEQGRAGYLGDGDPHLRVLLAQLTVSSTSNVRGTVAISGINNTTLSGFQSFTVAGQTFNSIPAPGALPLVGFAALITTRRRRTSSIAAHTWVNSGGVS